MVSHGVLSTCFSLLLWCFFLWGRSLFSCLCLWWRRFFGAGSPSSELSLSLSSSSLAAEGSTTEGFAGIAGGGVGVPCELMLAFGGAASATDNFAGGGSWVLAAVACDAPRGTEAAGVLKLGVPWSASSSSEESAKTALKRAIGGRCCSSALRGSGAEKPLVASLDANAGGGGGGGGGRIGGGGGRIAAVGGCIEGGGGCIEGGGGCIEGGGGRPAGVRPAGIREARKSEACTRALRCSPTAGGWPWV